MNGSDGMNNESCIQTIELLRNLALNIHGVIDVVDDRNCNDIIALLKEQDAVKPIRKLAYTKQGWFCGNCDNRLNRNGKYCSFCGKPILWEGR